MDLYPHQKEVVDKALPVLAKHKLVYLIMEVRTGKTLTSFTIASEYLNRKEYIDGYRPVVGFITKKKAIPSIEKDFNLFYFYRHFRLELLNYERINEMPTCDLWIIDEAHSCGQYPKASIRTRQLKEKINGAPVILLSGTPTPESYSQIYHQLWITGNSPFAHKKFYEWAKDGYVNIKQKMLSGFKVNDYSRANEEKIKSVCDHLFISCSQADAGFTCEVIETFEEVKMNDITKYLYNTLEKDQVVKWKDVDIIADTPANKINKFSQLAGGTIIQEENTFIIDEAKAVHIRKNYKGKRLAIYYRYKAELTLLEKFFPNNTKDWVEFENGIADAFLCQIQSGREGISLRTADYIIMYNIDFSATSYWQVRARMQYKDRTTQANVVWLFSDLGIEQKVYNAVSNKKNFTVSYYKKISSVRKQSTGSSSKKAESQRVASGQNNVMLSPWLARPTSNEGGQDNISRGEGTGQRSIPTAKSEARPVAPSWF